jgi:hypothetical protein
MAAQSAAIASWEFPPKSTILYIVCATVAFSMVMKNTPKKLKTAAIIMALPGRIDLVDTQVAIAFGASVQPFTNITPRTRTIVINSAGLDTN